MSETLEIIIGWSVIFGIILVILIGIYFSTLSNVKKNINNYKGVDCYKGMSDKEIMKKVAWVEVKSAFQIFVIFVLIVIGGVTCCNGCFRRDPDKKDLEWKYRIWEKNNPQSKIYMLLNDWNLPKQNIQ